MLTTSAVIQALLLFPHVAKTAQQEIDRVCGTRLPTLTDDLSYIRCCIKESLRWMPTPILGIPHAVTREDEYMGYTIPKDASVILNVWALHNHPLRFPNPRVFAPERYRGDATTAIESANSNDPGLRDHFTFGAGRRFCQGTHVAERSLFLGMARLLWAFDFEKEVDGEGEPVWPDASELTEGGLVQPKPFAARIRPRSEERAEAVRREWEVVQGLLDGEGQWKALPREVAEKGSKADARG
jgi:cytochrome P450